MSDGSCISRLPSTQHLENETVIVLYGLCGSVWKVVLPQLVMDPFRMFEGWNRKFDCPVAPHVPVMWYWRLTGPVVWVSSQVGDQRARKNPQCVCGLA